MQLHCLPSQTFFLLPSGDKTRPGEREREREERLTGKYEYFTWGNGRSLTWKPFVILNYCDNSGPAHHRHLLTEICIQQQNLRQIMQIREPRPQQRNFKFVSYTFLLLAPNFAGISESPLKWEVRGNVSTWNIAGNPTNNWIGCTFFGQFTNMTDPAWAA